MQSSCHKIARGTGGLTRSVVMIEQSATPSSAKIGP